MAHLARLMAVLAQPPPTQEVQVTPFGRLHPPLGFERYKAIQVVAALLRTEDPTAAAGKPSQYPLLYGLLETHLARQVTPFGRLHSCPQL